MHLPLTPFTVPGLLLAALTTTTAVTGFVLPEGLPDGIYVGGINATTGGPILTKIADLSSSSSAEVITRSSGSLSLSLSLEARKAEAAPFVGGGAVTRALAARDQTGCTGRTINNFDFLYNTYRDACARGDVKIPPKQYVLMSAGGEFWYGCNYMDFERNCNANDIKITYDSVAFRCGHARSGWDHLDVPNFTSGVEQVGIGICGNL